MYIYQYKGQYKEFTDMILQSSLFKCLTSPKLLISTVLLFWSGIPDFIEKYLLSDIGFGKWLVLTMVIDLATGINKVWTNEGISQITSTGLRDTVSKCIQYGSFLIITHILTHFEIGGQVTLKNFDWLLKLAFEFLIFIEIKSVYENIRDTTKSSRLDFISELVKKGKEILNLFISKKK